MTMLQKSSHLHTFTSLHHNLTHHPLSQSLPHSQCSKCLLISCSRQNYSRGSNPYNNANYSNRLQKNSVTTPKKAPKRSKKRFDDYSDTNFNHEFEHFAVNRHMWQDKNSQKRRGGRMQFWDEDGFADDFEDNWRYAHSPRPARQIHRSWDRSHKRPSHALDERCKFRVEQRFDIAKKWTFPAKQTTPSRLERTLTDNILSLYANIVPSASHFKQVEQFVSTLQDVFASELSDNCTLHLFGSNSNALALKDESDVDLMLHFAALDSNGDLSDHPRWQASRLVHDIARTLRKKQYHNVLPVPRARIPIVKFSSHDLGMKADISVQNFLPLYNSHLLKLYSEADVRVRQLIYMIKYWVKRRKIGDSYTGTMHSYSYCLMVLHYCQTLREPVAPLLQDVNHLREEERQYLHEGGEVYDCTYVSNEGWHSRNTDSIGRLLAGFFQFYATYPFDQQVISIREGRAISRKEKGWHVPQERFSNMVCIEDPFIVNKNVCALRDENFPVLIGELCRAHQMLCEGKEFWREVCEPYDVEYV